MIGREERDADGGVQKIESLADTSMSVKAGRWGVSFKNEWEMLCSRCIMRFGVNTALVI